MSSGFVPELFDWRRYYNLCYMYSFTDWVYHVLYDFRYM